MKILLVKPYNVSDHIQPSLGLGYLANSVRGAHEVEILDCIKERMDLSALVEYAVSRRPDVVGLQFYTYDFNFVRRAVPEIKRRLSSTTIVAGGPHPSACGGEILEQIEGLDFIFQGEAEKSFPIFLDMLASNAGDFSGVPGLVYRAPDGAIRSNPAEFQKNLDLLGMPAWDLIHPESYPEAQHGAFFKNFPIAPIITTRGCPFDCTFCAACTTTGKTLRMRSAAVVADEIEMLVSRFGIREIHIVDDNFTLNREHAKSILKEVKRRALGISWAVPNGIRLGTLDEELLALMKETGCYMISVGIESGSDRILKLMKKNLNRDIIRREVNFIKSFGFEIAGFFVVGFPGETQEDIKKTIELAVELPLTRANFFTFLPLPGTQIYRELESGGELTKVDWNKFLFTSAPYVPKGMTRKQLKKLQREAFLRFFLRPGIIIKNFAGIKSFRHFKFLMRRALHWLG